MARDSDNALVAADGILYIGPTTAPAPTDAVSDPDSDFEDMGGFAKDNLGLTPNQSTKELFLFGEYGPSRVLITQEGASLTITLLEFTPQSWVVAFSGGTDDGTVYTPPPARTRGEKSLILDLFDDDKVLRVYLPRVRVESIGTISFSNEDWTPIPLTFRRLVPADGSASFKFLHGVLGS